MLPGLVGCYYVSSMTALFVVFLHFFFFTQHLENTLSCTRTTFRPSRETVLYFHSPRLCGTKRRCISTHGRKKVTRVRTALNSTSRKTHAAQKRLCSTNLVAPCTRRRRLLVYGGDRVNILFQDSMFEGLQTELLLHVWIRVNLVESTNRNSNIRAIMKTSFDSDTLHQYCHASTLNKWNRL